MSSTPSKTFLRTRHWVLVCELINREMDAIKRCTKVGIIKGLDQQAKELREYCEEQIKLAEAEGFDDTVTYISSVLDELP